VKTQFIGVTRALAIAGCTDFGWCDEEAKWKGCEVHRIVELRLTNRLDRKSVPKELKGYLDAIERFISETQFIPLHVEMKVKSKELGIQGRLDAAGLLKGRHTVVDFKSGPINPAVALQLALYGHMLERDKWWNRAGVHLRADGTYSFGKNIPLMSWHADLTTALAVARVSRWKLQQGLV
jgi:hypothetical protein